MAINPRKERLRIVRSVTRGMLALPLFILSLSLVQGEGTDAGGSGNAGSDGGSQLSMTASI